MKETNMKCTIYEKAGFYIEIIETPDCYESWIQYEDYGVKELMFGVPKAQQTLEEFLEIVEAYFDEHACFYLQQRSD